LHSSRSIMRMIKYKDKLNSLLESGVYEPLSKDRTAKDEREIQKLVSKCKTTLSDLKHKLTPYHTQPPHLHGLPKIHKPGIPLRLIVSFVGSACYALAGFLHKILNPLVGKSKPFLKNSGHFVQLLKIPSLDLTSSVFSPMFHSTKPHKSSEIGFTTVTHWRNSLPCSLKPSWGCWRFA
jgi:hypothetical protein